MKTAIHDEVLNVELVKSNYVLNSLFFDWFAVGVECSFLHFIYILESHFASIDFQEVSPRSGYDQAFKVNVVGRFNLLCMFGGSNTGTRLYVQCSGYESDSFRDFFVSVFVDSPVAFYKYDPVLIRADVAIDFDESGIFGQLTDILIDVSKNNRLKKSCLGDWVSDDDPRGRTLYIGSRQSPVMARLYEKGKTLVNPRPDLCRLELEIKPKRVEARRQYVGLSAWDLVFCNAWSTSLFSIISGVVHDSAAVSPGTVHKDTDHERAFAHMVKQYRATIKKELDILGGDYMMLLSSLLGSDDYV